MVQGPDHCENSEIYCTLDDFLILKELHFTFYIQTPNDVVNTVLHT